MDLLRGRLRDDDDDDDDDDDNTNISVELLSGYCLENDLIKEYDREQLRKHDTSYTALLIRNTALCDTKHILK
jgi:hypothetical protein